MQGPFRDVGINLRVLSPGKPLCRYHRENAQEDFLVLSGSCTLLVNGEERSLRAWDFVHCPPGVTHVLVGAGEGPCIVICIGHRKGDAHELFYPASDLARSYGAEAPEPTDKPAVAYSDVEPPVSLDDVDWPLK
jgi:uncharacterized cupin superfamily protein